MKTIDKTLRILSTLSALVLIILLSNLVAQSQSTKPPESEIRSIPDTTKKSPPVKRATNKSSNDPIFLVVEHPPQFPGGLVAMKKYILQNLINPNTTPKLTGKVFVAFVVNADGSLQDIEIKKGLSQAYNEEALRIVNLMPKWQPGIQSGRAMRVRYLLPIEFQ